MRADPFSRVLQLVDVSCRTAASFQAGGDWSFRLRRRNGDINVTAVLAGSCWIQVPDCPDPILLRAGDIAVLSRQPWHVISSEPTVFPREANALFAQASSQPRAFGADPNAVVVASHLSVEEPAHSLLLQSFAPLALVKAGAPQASTLSWLIQRTWAETSGFLPGGGFAARQYAGSIFTEILRRHLDTQDSVPLGTLRLWTDEELAPAVHLMHDDPARQWRLEELASASRMSRTSFAERFRVVAGTSPLAYLNQWRIVHAKRALQSGDTSISDIATAAGYSSVSAFSNSFKRQVGTSPTAFRRQGHAEKAGKPEPHGAR